MDILTVTPLYREGGLFSLPDEYLSFVADKILEGGGGGDPQYHSDFSPQIQSFFFIFIQICLFWRVADLHELSSPVQVHAYIYNLPCQPLSCRNYLGK